MKKSVFKYVLCALLTGSMGLTSCTDYFERDSDSVLQADDAFKNFANFKGRSTRSEFWYSVLFSFIVGIGIWFMGLFMSLSAAKGLSYVVEVIMFVPSTSVGVRRLHDAGKSGWWIAGPIIAAVVMAYISVATALYGLTIDDRSTGALIGLFYLLMLPICIVIIIFWCRPSEGANKWGLPPRPTGFRR